MRRPVPVPESPFKPAAIALALAGLVFLGGCHNLTVWQPVRTDHPLAVRGSITIEGVEVMVRRFGVMNTWALPQVSIRVRNQGQATVHFDPGAALLDKDHILVPVIMERGLVSGGYTLAPGEQVQATLRFDTRLKLVKRDDPSRKDLRVMPRVLELRLPPLRIDGREHPLPPLRFSAPD